MQPDQIILVADNNGKHTGEYVKKEVAHKGRGKRHLAITVLLYNDRNQVLLQKRKHKVHNDIWDLTGSTHRLHRSNGTNETTAEATYRCLQKEYGIYNKIPLKILGGINYFAADGKFCENEHDIIVTGKYSGEIKPNKDVHFDYKWVNEKVFVEDVSKYSDKYAPWAVKALDLIKASGKNDFEDMLKVFLGIFENYSSSYFAKKIKNSSKYPKLITKFYEDLADFTTGGKRLRAFLVYLGYLVGKGEIFHWAQDDIKRILPIALAVEIAHSFLLIHDDIIDKSDVRRDKPTIHKRYEKIFGSHYGISQAIVLGDIASFEAFNLINSTDFTNNLKLICQKKLYDVLLETAYGEALDIEYSYRDATFASIKQVADLKTARYSFVGPLTIGAILGGLGPRQVKALEKFGLLLGLAFQLQDDLLGVFGDEFVLGKSVLSDMREGKNTLLMYKAFKLAGKSDARKLRRLWGKADARSADLELVKSIVKKSGAYSWCEDQMKRLVGRSADYIPQITGDASLQKVFIGLGGYIIERRS